MKKTKIVAIVLIMMIAFAIFAPMAAADSIMDRVNSAGGGSGVGQLEQSAMEAGDSVIGFLRNVAIIVAVIMFVVVAYGLLFSPDVRTISDCKGRVGALILAIAVAVLAEAIVGTLLHWFGWAGT